MIASMVLMSLLMSGVCYAEVKVVVCPMFAIMGEKSACTTPQKYREAVGNSEAYNKMLTGETLQDLSNQGWKIVNIESETVVGGKIHRITLQR